MSLRSLCKELVFALREAFVLGEGAGRGAGRHRLQPCPGLSPLLSCSPCVPTQGYSHIPGVTLGLFPHPWGCSALKLSGTVVWALLLTHGCRVPTAVARRAQLWDRHPMAPSLPIPPARAHPDLTHASNKFQEHPDPICGLGTWGKPPALGTQQSHPEMCGECRHSLVCREMLSRTSFLQGARFRIHLYKFLAYFSEDVECIYLVLRLTKWVSWSGSCWEEEQAWPPTCV